MSDTLDPRRLMLTPLSDLARGRVSGRLDWQRRIEAARLPAPLGALVTRVVRRTRLWRSEKADVAVELIAHFADGLASGQSIASLVEAFGDERQAARLIRSAKRRARPIAWHAMRLGGYAIGAISLFYGAVEIRFLLGRASPRVDYVAQLNSAVLATAEAERAWPLYRRAILELKERKEVTVDADGDYLFDARPGGPRWAELHAWLAAHAPSIALARAAAAKPVFGFVFGPAGSRVDPEMAAAFPKENWSAVSNEPRDPRWTYLLGDGEAFLSNVLGHLINVLEADAADARASGDGARLVADVEALLGLARQFRNSGQVYPVEWTSQQAMIDALSQLTKTLKHEPSLLDDAALVRLAHELSGPRTASDLINLEPTRLKFLDLVQHAFTDDGKGDGRLTQEGLRLMIGTAPYRNPTTWSFWRAGMSKHLLPPSAIGESRRAAIAEYEHLLNEEAALLAMPRRSADWGELFERDSPIEMEVAEPRAAKTLAVRSFARSLQYEQENAERVLGQRDGAVVAIALELYRRRTGSYPATLAALEPSLLPHLPEDRFTGEPVKYRLVAGEPLVYSVGIDRKDDGGTFIIDLDGTPHPQRASSWQAGNNGSTDGDWILYDGRVSPTTLPDV